MMGIFLFFFGWTKETVTVVISLDLKKALKDNCDFEVIFPVNKES